MDHAAHRVLLVDDEVVNRMALARLLRQLGVEEVVEAADGAEALTRCARARYDLVICDIDMHPMDGLVFLENLRARADSPSTNAPVIMLSKYSSATVVRSARDVGASAYLVKPVSRDELADKLARVVPPTAKEASS